MAKPRDRKREALRRLGVTAEQLRTAPDLSSMFKQAHGGLTGTLKAMRSSESPSVRAFLQKYDAIPVRDRKSLSWEAIGLAAEIDFDALTGGIVLALQARSVTEVKIIALSHHPEVMRKRIEYAKLAGGVRDRDAIDTGLRFLPTNKGNTFIFNPAGGTKDDDGDDEQPEPVIDARESDLDHLFPDLKRTQEALVPVSSRMIEAGG
jgi:hypothetical protein